MSPATLLAQFVDALDRGSVAIVDLTQPLGPATPVIGLPPIFAASPGVTIDVISHYDDNGPAWYWNTLRFGEHTGTHFDAPVHWVTGRDLPDNRCDTIPPGRFVGPACVIDVSADVAKDPDFLLLSTMDGDRERMKRDVLASSPLRQLSAVKSGHMVVLDSDPLMRAGPRIVDAVEQMARAFYPTRFAAGSSAGRR